MLKAFGSAMKTPDLRKKILFTLAIVALYRVGAQVPSPGVLLGNIKQCVKQATAGGQGDIYSLVNLFSGGALLQLSIFALGIMPYITASIIIQLLTVVIPRFELLKKEGQSGQNKLTQYTRYLTIALGVLQATGIIALARSGQLFQCDRDILANKDSIFQYSLLVLTMTAGTALIMWFGELITEKGIGNGMSLLMATSIAARIPAEGTSIASRGQIVLWAMIALSLVVIVTVVFVEQAQRRIPVQYAKKMIGRKMYGGTSTYLPLKVNQAGVIPVIFASSLLYIPQLITQLQGNSKAGPIRRFFEDYVINMSSWVHIVLYLALIIFFAYFYVAITFNPEERADEMKRYGGFIPGIRPGRPTAEYLQYVLSRITLPGALYLGVVAILPNLLMSLTGPANGQNFPFGGTAVLILVGVALETVKQIESQLQQRNYEGFLR
ncbi:preprotein translocase subunit SecY [Cumulibacter manganitolerans]|uniref:preprotein translocase subunit SecY n=1 Tax=Cumulibacter manganitolerans TaxID=1884992 RepID=UPI001294F873|nr:preprotein translocase subunit SecY [Cumulibacter manganitolerans]